ncbi:MAG: toprim domain-containing protein [Phascolarctobacterium sp.]|nr:toprim domain-containing protein [Candidatus Phascolarctobacterium caballi]
MYNNELLEIKEHEPDFLPKARRSGYICPKCDNGTGASGDGLTLDKSDPTRTHYKCFKCGFYGDVIDLVGLAFGLEDDKDKFNKARELFGVQKRPVNKNTQKDTIKPPVYERTEEPEIDFSDFIKEAASNNDFQYLLSRGISEETQRRFNVGYVPNWKSPKAVETVLSKGGNPDNLPTSPRVIIPRNNYNYLARDTRKDLNQEQKAFEKQNTGKVSLFNIEALKAPVVFIVEGEIDAMSIEEAGGNACGLCSVANRRLLLDYLKANYKGNQCFILMLDNDEAGQKATAELKEGLERLEVPFIVAEYEAHDPNDQLQADKEGLEVIISSLKAASMDAMKEQTGNQYNAKDLLAYFENIENEAQGIEAKTGFEDLDANLQGGLHEGLYIIGAISSLGKTTFTLQIADQIAGTGQDVLFFSLEMSKYELIAKSLSRHSYDIARETKTSDGHFIARDTEQILNNKRYKYYTQEEKQVIKDAIKAYEAQAEHLFIYEGRYKGERLTVSHIRSIVENHVKTTGNKPVIFIDYLQILAPEDPRQTDKQATDTNTFELKEISRDFSIPVFAISSFNRENYLEPVSMTSFKESGAVEYSSDVLLGLQYAGMEYMNGETEKNRKERIRNLTNEIYRKKRNKEPIEIELKCLKQRKGYQFTLSFYMVNAFNHFEALLGRAAFQKCTTPTPFDNQEIL